MIVDRYLHATGVKSDVESFQPIFLIQCYRLLDRWVGDNLDMVSHEPRKLARFSMSWPGHLECAQGYVKFSEGASTRSLANFGLPWPKFEITAESRIGTCGQNANLGSRIYRNDALMNKV